jgi:glycosyltransferase involved in cell wall biosynthesis
MWHWAFSLPDFCHAPARVATVSCGKNNCSFSHLSIGGQIGLLHERRGDYTGRRRAESAPAVRIRFLTSTPLDILRGSGTYAGIDLLRRSLVALGHEVSVAAPRVHLPVFTAERWLFNRSLRPDPDADLTVGFDMDGYTIARAGHHVAALKGVIADEARFEPGLTRATMAYQARREREHALRAALVLTPSRYSAQRARDLYGLPELPRVVPEPIDLPAWRAALAAHPARPRPDRFTILAVGRLYLRKRTGLLLHAAAQLRGRIPGLAIDIVGRGPRFASLQALSRTLRLDNIVRWLGDVSLTELAGLYNAADLFCHPSVQEAFGIVFLEAMAAAKPIVAARAGAAPEVVPHAELVEPDSAEALAAAIESLYRSPRRRHVIAEAGLRHVECYDAPGIAAFFLRAVTGSTTAP